MNGSLLRSMWNRKSKNQQSDVQNLRRSPRLPLQGEVLIKRPGKPTVRCAKGNRSEGGLFLELGTHDLQKGKRVEVILVQEQGSVRELVRMSAIVLRVEASGVALVTYNSSQLKQELRE